MSARPPIRTVLAWALLACAAGMAGSGVRARGSPVAHWVGTWASSQQIPEPANALPAAKFANATLRQIVHLSLGARRLRVRLSNAFGTRALYITSVEIARPVSLASGTIDPATNTVLTFNGRRGVIIPAGAVYYSDPVAFDAPPLSNLAITMHLQAPPEGETSHPGARETSFLAPGDHVAAARLPGARRFAHWFFLSGVDVLERRQGAAIVALGDSITDGHATPDNSDTRWPDDLARRLQSSPATRDLGVVNVGTGGNRLLRYGLGPDALARFDGDVLAQSGVRYLIVLEGVNDLGTATMHGRIPPAQHAALVRHIIGAYRQIILRAHAEGIRVMGGTITPFTGSTYYHPSAATEADREKINAWIRTPGHFDAVADFDAAVRDPADPHRLRPAYDSGDHLHPNPAGYRAMADAVPLAFFAPSAAAARAAAPKLTGVPFHADGIYALGQKVGWTVSLAPGQSPPAGSFRYTIKTNDLDVRKTGRFTLSSGPVRITTRLDEPAMVYVAVDYHAQRVATFGAAVAPTLLRPAEPAPADFWSFWKRQLARLGKVPMDPVLTPMPTAQPGVKLYRVRLDSVGSHVRGYLAMPAKGRRFPALILYQWAGVYPLDTSWATNRAAQGWLTLDVDSHDIAPSEGSGVPQDYQAIGDHSRRTSYFLDMYLRDTRALQYIRRSPAWDGKTVVFLGTSMGGQQSLVTAGLNPGKVTAVLVDEPAGTDMNGLAHGRNPGYPYYDTTDAKLLATARYFDPVNFAPHITAAVLAAMGFIDTTAPPAGIWTALNEIPGPKEAVPLIDSDHNNITPDKQDAWLERSEAVLATLAHGGRFVPNEALTRPQSKRE